MKRTTLNFVSNIKIKQVLENPIRNQIIKILKKKEIEHYSSLRETLKCGSSVLTWHLETLEYFNLIRFHSKGKLKLIYLKNANINRLKIYLYRNFQSNQAISFIEALYNDKSNSWTMKDLIDITGFPRRTLFDYCKKLMEIDVLSYSRRIKQYFIKKDKINSLFWLVNNSRKGISNL